MDAVHRLVLAADLCIRGHAHHPGASSFFFLHMLRRARKAGVLLRLSE